MSRSYHHGDLRRAVLRAAVEVIAETGPGSVSLRGLARRAGVSHAAPAYHFGDKAGLLTAVAAEGFGLLGAELSAARERTGSFLEVGVAYVRFALTHRGYFEVMFRPDLYRADDPELSAARAATAEVLYSGLASLSDARAGADPRVAGVAAWSLVHGFSTLWLNGNLPRFEDDAEEAARCVARLLFQDG
ncbi:MAG: TetR/AcrR family transcriptional regulator [Nocardiopsaceae bacterium]|nr:TetR/AcrR family transcriptional regulator [Nocardiopsaceae bacterium]